MRSPRASLTSPPVTPSASASCCLFGSIQGFPALPAGILCWCRVCGRPHLRVPAVGGPARLLEAVVEVLGNRRLARLVARGVLAVEVDHFPPGCMGLPERSYTIRPEDFPDPDPED